MNQKKIFFIIIVIIIIIIVYNNTENEKFNSTQNCIDTDIKCEEYPEIECVTNSLYMMEKCPKRCNACNLTDNVYNSITSNATISKDLALGQCKDIRC